LAFKSQTGLESQSKAGASLLFLVFFLFFLLFFFRFFRFFRFSRFLFLLLLILLLFPFNRLLLLLLDSTMDR
jgi:hypothetical protein